MNKVRFFSFLVTLSSLLFFLSCKVDNKEGAGLTLSDLQNIDLSFSPTTTGSTPPPGSSSPTASTAAAQTFIQGGSQVIIEEAAFVIRQIKFRATDSHEEDFKTEALVVTLNLDGTSNVLTTSKIPVGTYDRIKFEIHKLDANEINAIDLTAHPEFSEFVKDNGFSVFVKGTYDNDISDNINATPFVFRSRLNEVQEYFLNRLLEVKEGQGVVDVHLTILTDRWFIVDGVLVDPTNANSDPRIDDNIKNSIKHF